MPIFEYKCKACGSRFETLLKSRNEKPKCACGSVDLEKLLSSFAVSENSAGSRPACESGMCGMQSPCASGHCPL